MLSDVNFYFLFYCFMSYALLGWILEVAFHIIKLHRFVNRGFLYGPLCPIYGVGAVLAELLLNGFRGNIVVLFAGGFVLGSLVEFAVGYLMEMLFKTRWWDYTEEGPNIYGYVCMKFSLVWGVLAVVFIEFINPPVTALIRVMPGVVSEILYQMLLVILVVDVTATINNLIQFRKFFSELHNISQEIKANLEELKEKALEKARILNLENRNIHLKEVYDKVAAGITLRHRSFLGAYPGITSKRFGEAIEQIRNKLAAARNQNKRRQNYRRVCNGKEKVWQDRS